MLYGNSQQIVIGLLGITVLVSRIEERISSLKEEQAQGMNAELGFFLASTAQER